MEALIFRIALTGILLAITAAPMGCFMMWQRMAFYGAAIAHASILGLAIASIMGINLQIGLVVAAVSFAFVIKALQNYAPTNLDTQLSIVSHSMLAIGLVLLSVYSQNQINLMQFLFGDILSINYQDTVLIAATSIIIIILTSRYFKPLLLATISAEIAQAEGLNVNRLHLGFLVALALFVSISIQVIGLLLVMAILIIPPAASKAFSKSPSTMIFIAGLIGSVCVLIGIAASWFYDVPAGPAIVVAAFVVYLLSIAKIKLLPWL
ncbi:MAG: zinc transport system permease protein [Saprospiraceae bacterium]|jgi:zinc transport system permease protein